MKSCLVRPAWTQALAQAPLLDVLHTILPSGIPIYNYLTSGPSRLWLRLAEIPAICFESRDQVDRLLVLPEWIWKPRSSQLLLQPSWIA